ncbi:hypothetical protein TeGR_g10041, partial [Tetraparma gracilis]
INLPACLIAYYLIFHSPSDSFYKLSTSAPGTLLITFFAQLFRATGIPRAVDLTLPLCRASAYYPTPLLGPILAATLMSNVGPLYRNGFQRHFADGAPWNFQNGWLCAGFHHLLCNDAGPLGAALRAAVGAVPGAGAFRAWCGGDREMAQALISLFMVSVGIAQLPMCFGPGWRPFGGWDAWACEMAGLYDANDGKARRAEEAEDSDWVEAAESEEDEDEEEEEGVFDEEEEPEEVRPQRKAATPKKGRSKSPKPQARRSTRKKND